MNSDIKLPCLLAFQKILLIQTHTAMLAALKFTWQKVRISFGRGTIIRSKGQRLIKHRLQGTEYKACLDLNNFSLYTYPISLSAEPRPYLS